MEKHKRLTHYLKISGVARKKFIDGRSRSATYIDLFCGTGRSRIESSGDWFDGGAVAAWKVSKLSGTPFTQVYVSDADEAKRSACVQRLKTLGASVQEIPGPAVPAASQVVKLLNRDGLHFAFLDPYSLGSLDFQIIRTLSALKRIDMLIHVSSMDMQRNLPLQFDGENRKEFDSFAPGWLDHVSRTGPQDKIRSELIDYWKSLVVKLGKKPSHRFDAIYADGGQRLYWLMLIAESKLAHKFWNVVTTTDQRELF